jgi:RNA polymerase II subunit A small phosphatase-like protein
MSTTPGNLITQVPRSDSEVDSTEAKPRKTLLQRLCCCFCKDPSDNYIQEDSPTQDVPIVQHTGNSSDVLPLLPPPAPDMVGKRCLVLDLDETLVHSSFKPIPNPDFIIPVEIEEQIHKVYVLKRPGVDQFLQAMGPLFEIVVFTASLSKYADPVLDLLDATRVVHFRLFREACTNYKGNFVKDLSRLGRELKHTIIIDNSPTSYLFHPENSLPSETWYDDPTDNELLRMIPVLQTLSKSEDVCKYLEGLRKPDGRIL